MVGAHGHAEHGRDEPGRSRCRIGFVGTGSAAHRHARVLSGIAGVDLVAATDHDRASAAAFHAVHGARAVPDLDALLAEGLDAVYVCVPPFAHGAVEVQVASARVAMFIESPLASDQATAEWVGRRICTSGVLTRVGLHWRCTEPVRRAQHLLAGRRIRLASGMWFDTAPPVPWWSDRPLSGGALVEQAVHVLDLVRLLVGEVLEVHASASGRLPGGAEAATGALLCFANGAVGPFATTCVLDARRRAGLEIVADGVVVGVGEDWLDVRDAAGVRHAEYDPVVAHTAVDRAFVSALRGRRVAPGWDVPDHAEALRSHRLACTLARSAASRRAEPVQVD